MWVVLLAAAAPAATLDFQAPLGCPESGRFADEVSARLGRVAFTATGPLVVVRIEDGDPAWGTLEVAGGIRRVEGADCDRVFESLIAAAAVVLDPAPLAVLRPPEPTGVRPAAPPVDWLLREPPPFGLSPAPEWIVRFDSGSPMDTASFLRTTEAPEYLTFRRDMQRKSVSTAALGSTGTALFLLGLYGLPTTLILASPPYPSLPREVPIAVGAGMLVGGVLASASVPKLIRIRRHQRDPSLVVTAERADALIEEYNASLEGL